MKRFLIFVLVTVMTLSSATCLFGCEDKPKEYTGKLGLYSATISFKDDKATLALNIEENGSGVSVNNIVRIVGTVKSVNGDRYTVSFADEKTEIYLKYVVEGEGAEGYLRSLTEFLITVVKTDEDKALVKRLGKGEEISFGIDSALYTSLSGMPGDCTVRIFKHDGSFSIID